MYDTEVCPGFINYFSKFIEWFQSRLFWFIQNPLVLRIRKNPFGVAFGGCLMVKQIVSWDINSEGLRFVVKKQKDTAI